MANGLAGASDFRTDRVTVANSLGLAQQGQILNVLSFGGRVAARGVAVDLKANGGRAGTVSDGTEQLVLRAAALQELGRRVFNRLIEPRAAELAKYLDAATEPVLAHTGLYTVLRVRQTPRCPVNASLVLGVEWEVAEARMWLCSGSGVLQVLLDVSAGAHLEIEVHKFDVKPLTTWIEERALEFLDAYVALAQDESSRPNVLRVDPVCGRRMRTADARHTLSWTGRSFHFCSDPCLSRFASKPEIYAGGRIGLRGPSGAADGEL